jgi:asparagine synthase (glutamine-hydrolysing)
MCGIAGIIQLSPIYNSTDVKRMTDALSHRGPDGEGFWQNENAQVVFGHRRLSIIDLSDKAGQPMHYLGRYTILHNGEIYNYMELRESLIKKGYNFNSKSDTEVIAAAYDHWNEECVDQFDGMFAFTIYDNKEKEFFAARDRFGEKPFFYSYDNVKQVFCFASEMKALWVLGLKRNPNLKMLFNFLTIGYVDNPSYLQETFDNEIEKLPPAHLLKIKIGERLDIVIEKYWDIDFDGYENKISDDDAIEKLNQLFSTSVTRRLRSDVALGTSLSGGIDSSSIVATICSNSAAGTELKTFSAIFPAFEKNEEKYIDQVTRKFGLRSFKTEISIDEIPSLLQAVMYQQDEPIASASLIPQFKVFQLAQRENVKVLLDGQGADEILAGYTKYYKWYWQELFSKRKLLRSGEMKAAKANGVNERFGFQNVIAALVPDFASVFLERHYLLHALRQQDLARDFVKFQSKEAYYSTPAIFTLNGVLYFNTCMHGLEELLRYADRNSMAHGREVRLPFLSHELVEFVFSLPSNFKIRNGWTKWMLRKSKEKVLPTEIVWRKDKIGFEPPQQIWMQLPEVKEMIHSAKKKLVDEKILKPSVLNKSIEPSAAYERDNYDWRYLSAAHMFQL